VEPGAPSRRTVALVGAAIGALAAAVRLVPWAQVFTERGIRLLTDGDPWFHLHRVWSILERAEIPWHDPWLNYPAGADVIWPPGWDLLLAGAAWVVGLGHPSRETAAVVASIAPVVVGVVAVAVVAALARELFGWVAALAAAWLYALAPPAIVYSVIGRPDHHVLEVLLFCLIALVYVRGASRERLRTGDALWLGLLVALSFWNWPGSPLTLATLGLAAAGSIVLLDPARPGWRCPAELVAAGAGVGTVLLAISIAVAGPPGALGRFTMAGLSAFPVLLCGLTAVLAAALLALARVRSRVGRASLALAGAVAALGLAAVVFPGAREAARSGLTAAGTADGWWGVVAECRPLLFSGLQPLADDLWNAFVFFGFVPVLALAGAVACVPWIREGGPRASAIGFALGVTILFVVATLRVQRFMLYAAPPLAIMGGVCLARLRAGIERRRPGAGAWTGAVVALLAVAPGLPVLRASFVADDPALEAALEVLRTSPSQGDRQAVLAPPDLGHHVIALADRPVLASPFGVEGGPGAMSDFAAFYAESDLAAMEALLARRGIQFVLLQRPLVHAVLLFGHVGTSTGLAAELGVGAPLATLEELIAVRLHQDFGRPTVNPPRPALDAFRLVYDEQQREGMDPGDVHRLFEYVAGARVLVRGAGAHRPVTATVSLEAPWGGQTEWIETRTAEEGGEALLRLPYATGPNGRILAGPWLVTDGVRTARLEVSEEDVLGGRPLTVDLRPPLR
jgi:dolichyl-diphosphooligosaccharide--protein glycosyltransferase